MSDLLHSHPLLAAWLSAFLLTQLVEMPIWLAAARRLGWKRAFLIAFGTSALTHPLLWFAIPWDRWPYEPTVIGAEIAVVIVETLFAGALGLKRPWLWALIANGASIAAGTLTRWAFGWP